MSSPKRIENPKVFLAIHNSDTAPDQEVQKQVADGGIVSQLQLYEVCLFECDTRLYLNHETSYSLQKRFHTKYLSVRLAADFVKH